MILASIVCIFRITPILATLWHDYPAVYCGLAGLAFGLVIGVGMRRGFKLVLAEEQV